MIFENKLLLKTNLVRFNFFLITAQKIRLINLYLNINNINKFVINITTCSVTVTRITRVSIIKN